MSQRLRAITTVLWCCLGACQEEVPGDGPPAANRCQVRVAEAPLRVGIHVPFGTEITTWSSNPPSSGDHYPIWARWNRTYLNPLPRGIYVHNVEHGGVVYLFHCPAGCAGDVASLEALAASLPTDPRCTPPLRTRNLLTADPLLPSGVAIAAVAWGYVYTSSCLDQESLREFTLAHYGRSYENHCDQGEYQGSAP